MPGEPPNRLSRNASHHIILVAAADWIASEDFRCFVFPLQVAAFIVLYLRHNAVDAATASRFQAGRDKMQERIARYHSYADEIERAHKEARAAGRRNHDFPGIFRGQVKLARLYRLRGRNMEGIMNLHDAFNTYLTYGPNYDGWLSELKEALTEFVSAHADYLDDLYLDANEDFHERLREDKGRMLQRMVEVAWDDKALELAKAKTHLYR